MGERWDYAIVLDACRYDLFAEVNRLGGKLYKKESTASATMEWIRKSIKQDYPDTVIIAANPHFSKLKLKQLTGEPNRFYKNIPAWDIGYDDELKVTPPWTMIEIVKKRINKFEDKRIIIWFNQPHRPFLGGKILDITYGMVCVWDEVLLRTHGKHTKIT